MSGFPGNLSKEQEDALAEFRLMLQEHVEKQDDSVLKEEYLSFCDDVILLKFLRARKFVIADSFKMITECIWWRCKFAGGVKHIRDEDVMSRLQVGIGYYRHTDKKGNPIYWVRVRLHDKTMRDLEGMKKYMVHQMELGRMIMHPPIEQTTVVFDMRNIGLKNIDLAVGKFLAEMLQNNYPEFLANSVTYGAPIFFWAFWHMLKPFLDPKTAAKLHIASRASDLEPLIDIENIPVSMGGRDTYEYHYLPTILCCTDNEREQRELALHPGSQPPDTSSSKAASSAVESNGADASEPTST